MKLTVAVTGLHAGENPQPGVGVIRSLRRRFPELTIIGLVYDVLESGIYQDDCADLVFAIPYPSAGTDALLGRLDQILTRYPIDVLIPTLDAEIMPMIALQRALAARHIATLLPSLPAFNARSKSVLPELAARCGCQTPRLHKATDVNSLLVAEAAFSYPMIIKGPYYEAYKVNAQYELFDHFYALLAKWGGPVLVQEFIDGQEFNIMAVSDSHGEVMGFCPIRKMIRSQQGKGYGGIVIQDEVLNRTGMTLIRALQWRGPLELEFIQDEASGAFYLLEINPRFPAWVDFPSTFGHNMPALLIDELVFDGMTPLPPCEPGVFYLRATMDITCRVEDMGQLTTFGEWQSRKPADSLLTLA